MITNHKSSLGDWFAKIIKTLFSNRRVGSILNGSILHIKYIPWFSIVGFSSAALFCIAFGAVLSHFMTREILDHDAIITSQFISSVEWVETKQAQLGGKVRFGQLLDKRTNFAALGIDEKMANEVRAQYFDHISMLPDVRLATIFAHDRTIIWSTNSGLVGKINEDNDELEEAFAERKMVSNDSFSGEHEKEEQQFISEPGTPFVETYIPLFDSNGRVAVVVEIYQEPHQLLQTIHRGKLLIWACIALGAAFLYIIPLWIFRRVDSALSDQQRRLREAEALCVIGEMSATVAHGIRNPLATIRSSAELALDANPSAARKNAEDIITQVDRLSKWVRDLLVYTRPVSGEDEAINVVTLVGECLANVADQIQKKGIVCEFVQPTVAIPLVIGNRVLANQALASIISNAIDAMPNGGSLRLQVQESQLRGNIDVIVSDTGGGMSPAQTELAFKPFYTTKHNGIGLGMSQVRRIMERFGGAVKLSSKEGEGTQANLSFRQERRPS
jgi:two-component system sensor histidine kinase HydH